MTLNPLAMTRAQVAWLLGMSETWVAIQMRAGALPRPGQPAPDYVAAFVRLRAGRGARQ